MVWLFFNYVSAVLANCQFTVSSAFVMDLRLCFLFTITTFQDLVNGSLRVNIVLMVVRLYIWTSDGLDTCPG